MHANKQTNSQKTNLKLDLKIHQTIFSTIYRVCLGVKNSKSQPIYIKTDQKVEKWIKVVDFVFVKVTPILSTWTAFIVSFFTYFATDLGDSVFELPVPMWYN